MLPQQDLVKSVSKNLKYYFDVKRREDGFDLSGPYVPRPDHPPVKSRPTLMYDGLHDKPVKHYFTQSEARRVITHMKPPDPFTMDKARQIKRQLRRHMNKYSFKMPWVGTSANDPKGITNSSKYVTDPFQMLRESPREAPRFTKPFRGGRPLLRAAPPHNISKGEAVRLVNAASRSLFALISSRSTADQEEEGETEDEGSGHGWGESKIDADSNAFLVSGRGRRPATASGRSSQDQKVSRLRGSREAAMFECSLAGRQRIAFGKDSTGPSQRPKSAHAVLQLRFAAGGDSDQSRESDRSDGRTQRGGGSGEEHDDEPHQPAPPAIPRSASSSATGRSGRGRQGSATSSSSSSSSASSDESGGSVSIRDDGEAKAPPAASAGGAVAGLPKPSRPKSAKRTDRTERDRYYSDERSHSRVTLSEDGSYEEVPLDDTDPEDDEALPAAMRKKKSDEKGVQTGWELFSTFDPSESMVLEGKRAHYRIRARTGNVIGASGTAPIHVVLFGSHGHSPDIPLEHSSTYTKPFQKGHEDIFSVETLYVGELKRIRIGHNREDTGQWFLDSVAVDDLTKGWVYEFPCNKWLSSKSEDRMTRRDLNYSSTRLIEATPDEPYTRPKSIEPTQSTSVKAATQPAAENGIEGGLQQRRHRGTSSEDISGRASPSFSMGYSHLSTAGSREDDAAVPEASQRGLSTPPLKPPPASNVAVGEYELGEQSFRVRNTGGGISTLSRKQEKKKEKSSVNQTFFDILLKSNQDGEAANDSSDDEAGYLDFFELNAARPGHLSVPRNNGVREAGDADEAASDDASQERSTVVFENMSDVSRQDREKNGYILDSKASHTTSGAPTISALNGVADSSVAESAVVASGPTIHGASRVGNLARIKDLVHHSANLKNSIDDIGDTPLHVACKYGHADVVKWLVEDARVDDRARNRAGYEAIHEASLHGHLGCLRTLLTSGIAKDVNLRSDDDRTPLHLAASAGHQQTCSFLVANGASLSAQDSLGRTAADLADEFNHHGVHDYLEACQRDAAGLVAGANSSLSQAAVPKGLVHADDPGMRRTGSSTQWRDDVLENFPEDDDEIAVGSSTVDLRHKVEHKHELEEKKKLYDEMQEKKKSGMSFLDMVRLEAGGGSDDSDANND